MKDPYQEGYVAACEGKSAFDNPYDVYLDRDRNCDWHDGFICALNDQHAREVRAEKWREFWYTLKQRFIQCLYSMAFFAVCYIIGITLRHLLR